MRWRERLERGFFLVERVVTALLYSWCVARERFGRGARVPILMYHQVGDPLRGVRACQDCVSPGCFTRQLRAILRAGYRVISLGQLVRWLDASPDALKRCVVLTFDDGFRGQFRNAYPVLRRYGVPATFFLIAGYIGTDTFFPHLGLAGRPDGGRDGALSDWRPLSWDEAKGLARNGMEIGSHSVSHRSLGRMGRDEAAAEVRRSKEILEERLGIRVEGFAYPFGSRAYRDFDRGVQELLREAGYRVACTTVVGRNSGGADRLALRRIPVEEADGPFRIRCKLVGAYDWVGAVKALWQRLVPREESVDLELAAPQASARGSAS
ncbi:MAG: polysaccharide deacetylase family protein [Candidatus Rokubacteria bacterium]|nr:polysaccharide deacetylase family protein [Candidatus Rokubacteria bacterium]